MECKGTPEKGEVRQKADIPSGTLNKQDAQATLLKFLSKTLNVEAG
jgi:hypothetical protein